MESESTVLVVDDDPELRSLISEYLRQQRLGVVAAGEGRQMRAVLKTTPVQLIVLDLMLPGEDGLALLRWLRESEFAHVPVLMLTARGDNIDRIIGLEMGADDYLAKPFVPRELAARIVAILRRSQRTAPQQSEPPPARWLAFGEWRLDTVERNLVDAQGAVTPLAGAEFGLLLYLLQHPNRIVTREQILERIGREMDHFDRSIDLRVSRLRKRLGDSAREPAYIKTVRNEGYVFCKTVVAAESLAAHP
jgi:two-component system, OmpR family, response regulator